MHGVSFVCYAITLLRFIVFVAKTLFKTVPTTLP